MIETYESQKRRGVIPVIHVKPNTVEFSEGGIEIRGAEFDFYLKATRMNRALVKQWLKKRSQ